MDKKGLFILITLLLFATNLFATNYGETRFKGYITTTDSLRTTGDFTAGDVAVIGNDISVGNTIHLGLVIDSNSCITSKMRNKAGATLFKGDFVAPDSAGWFLEGIKKDQITTSDSFYATIATEGTPFGLLFRNVGTGEDADTIYIYGTQFGSTNTKDTIKVGTTATSLLSSRYLWTDIDSISLREADAATLDSTRVFGFSLAGIIASKSYLGKKTIGVVYDDSITDNSVGNIVISGRCEAEVEVAGAATPIEVGDILTVNARGNAVDIGSAMDSSVVLGHALQPFGGQDADDSALIWIEFISK